MGVLRCWVALLILGGCALAAKKAAESNAPQVGDKKKHSEPVIEEVTAKQLERVLNEKDFVAVFWCKFSQLCFVFVQCGDVIVSLRLCQAKYGSAYSGVARVGYLSPSPTNSMPNYYFSLDVTWIKTN